MAEALVGPGMSNSNPEWAKIEHVDKFSGYSWSLFKKKKLDKFWLQRKDETSKI